MKMKRIAAVLTALATLSGCAGNTVTEEAVATTRITTVAVDTTAETTSGVETSEKKTAVPPWELTKPEGQTEETTTIATLTVEEEIVPIEIVATVEAFDLPTELTAIYMLFASSFEEFRSVGYSPVNVMMAFDIKNVSPSTSFVRDWGCYPSAFIHVSQTTGAFKVNGINYGDYLVDLTGSDVETIYEYIDKGIPVAVWATKHLTKPEPQITTDSGEILYGEKDCIILVGYNSSSVMYWSSLEGEYITYRKDFFERRYEEMGSMALTVVKE